MVRPYMMLTDFAPVPVNDMIEEKRSGRGLLFGNPLLRLFPLALLYRFRFSARRAFSRAVKPMTSDLE